METKSAFISIIGRANVGKSSFLNKALGQKVSIVSNKPQTTRTKIMGVKTIGNSQLVFIDTPGFHKPKNILGEKMIKAVSEGITGIDAALLIVEAVPRFKFDSNNLPQAELELIETLKKQKIPTVLGINKIDLLENKEELLTMINAYAQKFDDITDQPDSVMVAELIREKLLRTLSSEVPHGIAVTIDRFFERDNKQNEPILEVEATIFCEKDSHKGIIIGKNGVMLKNIGTKARIDIEKFFGIKTNLKLWVKVKEDWRNRQSIIHTLGLD